MLLLVGLGSPGTEYARTRHNVGFMAVDEIAHRYSFTAFKPACQGLTAGGMLGTEKALILKPETYMNDSGKAVLAACSFYKLAPKDIIVFHDDMDLPVGKVKVKRGGSAGGHNGLKSIDAHIGTDYLRVRIGTGRPENKADVIRFVLAPFAPAEQEIIDGVVDRMAEHIGVLMRDEGQTFMNRLMGQ